MSLLISIDGLEFYTHAELSPSFACFTDNVKVHAVHCIIQSSINSKIILREFLGNLKMSHQKYENQRLFSKSIQLLILSVVLINNSL